MVKLNINLLILSWWLLSTFSAATFNVTKYSKDYSCYHAYGWAENDGYYNPYFSAYTNIVGSKYGLPTVTSSVFDKYEQEFHRRQQIESLNIDGSFSREGHVIRSQAVAASNAWKVYFTGIPKYNVYITSSQISTLNSRPDASSDFTNGATTAVSGDFIVYGESLGYSSSSCSMGYWPPGPDCPAQYSGFYVYNLQPAPEANTGKRKYSYYYMNSMEYIFRII
jgi:hypothetical protein